MEFKPVIPVLLAPCSEQLGKEEEKVMQEHLLQEVGIYVYGKGSERVSGSTKKMRILTGKLALSDRKSSWGELLVCLWERHLGDKTRHLVEIRHQNSCR